ncbi:MAG TPA: cupin domain-containing protein [Anaerolineaceae bacterium]|nr:cupin domain-containing protein [Anaerolineaceae bacterium]
MNQEKDAVSLEVGTRLKELREARHISMRELARRSELSANALSMIERNLTSPSVSTLNKLASALEIPITAFFRTIPEKQKIVFLKATERNRVPFNKGLWEGLGGEYFQGRIEAFMLTLETGGSSGPHGMLHSGHEFVFCLRGNLIYEVEDKKYYLEAGDSLIFSSQLLHRWQNTGPNVCNAIIVISGYEENENPSDYHRASAQIISKLPKKSD